LFFFQVSYGRTALNWRNILHNFQSLKNLTRENLPYRKILLPSDLSESLFSHFKRHLLADDKSRLIQSQLRGTRWSSFLAQQESTIMTKHFFISEHFLGKKGQSYRYT
jgi:hypothetical protein